MAPRLARQTLYQPLLIRDYNSPLSHLLCEKNLRLKKFFAICLKDKVFLAAAVIKFDLIVLKFFNNAFTMTEDTPKPNPDAYDFAGLRFRPQESRVVCLQTNREISLRRNLNEFLFLLLKKPRETVEYQEFLDNVAAWKIYKDVAQVTRTIHVTKGELIKSLRLLREDFDLIEAVPSKGYRLSADVSEFFAAVNALETTSKKSASNFAEAEETVQAQKIFGGHFGQVFFACAMYAALFVVALFIEIAYEFETFRNMAFSLAIPTFLWIWLTSVVGLFFGWRLLKKSFFLGFVSAAGIFLFAAILLYLSLGAFLPTYPITKASFQTYPADAAYLKSVFYFLALGIFLIGLPFIVVVWLETEISKNNKKVIADLRRFRQRRLSITNALSLPPSLLLGLTIIALLTSLLLTAHLFENLKPELNTNLFIQLVLWRWFLYFALAAECLLWYRASLNSLKARCFELASKKVTETRP